MRSGSGTIRIGGGVIAGCILDIDRVDEVTIIAEHIGLKTGVNDPNSILCLQESLPRYVPSNT